MKKLPKYLISQNNLIDNRIYLIHTRKPRFFGEVLKFETATQFDRYQLNPPDDNFCIVNGQPTFVGTRTKIGTAIFAMYVIDFIDEPGDGELPMHGQTIENGLMARTGDWLHNYFKTNI